MRLRKNNDLKNEDVLIMAQVSDALAHPARIKLLRHVMECNKQREMVCTGDLVREFDYAQATISQHMKKLVEAGLLETQKKDKFTYYYVCLGMMQRYINIVKNFDKLG